MMFNMLRIQLRQSNLLHSRNHNGQNMFQSILHGNCQSSYLHIHQCMWYYTHLYSLIYKRCHRCYHM